MHRNPSSHKGENGKVAIIGGSRFMHGAPIFSARSVQSSGVDLIYLCLPSCHEEVAKQSSLNFQVRPFAGDELTQDDIEPIVELLASMDSAVIGPGLDRSSETLKVIRELIESAPCPLVLDASALQAWTLDSIKGKNYVVTPHLGELERMKIPIEEIGDTAKKFNVTILVKDEIDHIASSDGSIKDISGGNAGLTVGGTGDALAGLIAGFIGQKIDHSKACAMASTIIKRAGTTLYSEKGFAYTTRDVIEQIPHLLKTLEE